MAAYGVDVGTDVANDALAWAWEHWDRVDAMVQSRRLPVPGRAVGGASASALAPSGRAGPEEVLDADAIPIGGPRLDEALARLSPRQRVAALLVHGNGWSYAEVAEATSVSVGSVRNDLHRAMKQLRRQLETS